MRKFIAAAMSAVMLLSAFPITAQAANENSSDAETAFYASPDGSDSNSGTESEPFKTIEKARDGGKETYKGHDVRYCRVS